MDNQNKEVQTVDLATLNPKQLPQLKGMFEDQKELVKNNPYIAIIDTATYAEAKKNRTALVKGRTKIQSEDKVLATYIKSFRTKVSSVTKELIDVTLPSEQTQQTEIDRWDKIKAEAKAEKLRIANERIETIKNDLADLYEISELEIQELEFKNIEGYSFEEIPLEERFKHFGEFENLYTENLRKLDSLLSKRIETLNTEEANRIESDRLEAEAEKLKEEKAEAKIKQDIIDAENQKVADENQRIANENKIESDRLAKIESDRLEGIESDRVAKLEADRIAKVESDRLAKVKSDKLDKIEADAKLKAKQDKDAKRIEALKPDKEKLETIINSIDVQHPDITLTDKASIEFRTMLHSEIYDLKVNLLNNLTNLK